MRTCDEGMWCRWHKEFGSERLLVEYGIQLYDRLHARKELEAVPALIMGAWLESVREDIKQRELLAVEKPFDLDEFLFAIESVLASSSGRQRL